MIGRFKYEKLSKYPHLSPFDTAIWERFMRAFPARFDSCDYDWHVGNGAAFLPTGDDSPEGRENRLYQKKIDVIGYKDNCATMIEVKPEANMKALGQMLVYFDLAKPLIKTEAPLAKWVIAERMDQDFFTSFARHSIRVILV